MTASRLLSSYVATLALFPGSSPFFVCDRKHWGRAWERRHSSTINFKLKVHVELIAQSYIQPLVAIVFLPVKNQCVFAYVLLETAQRQCSGYSISYYQECHPDAGSYKSTNKAGCVCPRNVYGYSSLVLSLGNPHRVLVLQPIHAVLAT